MDDSLRRNRDFGWLVWGRTCQMTGGAMTSLALMLYAVDLTGSTRWGAAVMAASTLGTLVMSLPAGALVDRWDRRRVMVRTSLALAVVLACVPGAALVGVLRPIHLVVIAVVIAVLSAFFGPAEQASLPRIVAAQDLGPAAAVNQARGAVASLLGPSVAGALYSLGRSVPLLGDALLNVVSAALVSRVRTPLPPPPQSQDRPRLLADLRSGLGFIVSTPAVAAIVTMNAIASFGFGGLLALITLTFKAHHLPDTLIGAMQTACGISGLAGALAGPQLLRRCRVSTLFIGGVLINCGCAALMAVWPQPYLIIGLLCLACVAMPPGTAGVQAYQITLTPDHLQGRVAGANGLLTLALAPAATMLAGSLTGQPWSLAMSPFLVAIVAIALIAITHPAIRTLGVNANQAT